MRWSPSIVAVLDGLSADELNWRPIAPATSSLYAIATHVLGNATEHSGEAQLTRSLMNARGDSDLARGL